MGGEVHASDIVARLAPLPYDIHIKAERYHQTIFYTFFRLVGIFVEAEARTSGGRIDAVVKAGAIGTIFRLKDRRDAAVRRRLRLPRLPNPGDIGQISWISDPRPCGGPRRQG